MKAAETALGSASASGALGLPAQGGLVQINNSFSGQNLPAIFDRPFADVCAEVCVQFRPA
jgi:hypothetical protein